MSNLLFLNELVSEDLTNVICLVATILVALLIVTVCILMAKSKLKTTDIVYAGVSLASSFVLSFIKIAPVQYGGSITLASFVPLLIYTFYFGFSRGLICGMVYGVLQFLQDPYILTPVTFILDYLLAFASIAVMGFFSKNHKNKTASLVIGTTCVYACRFLIHFASGLVYFNMGAVWASLPADSAVLYSLIYQAVYLLPDAIICIIAVLILSRANVIDKLKPKQ